MRLLILALLTFICFGCANSPDHQDWAQTFGGVEHGSSAARAQQITDQLEIGLEGYKLRVRVLRTDEVLAFSFPDGSIYLSSGLIRRAGDDEVAAAIAHEMGHLLNGGQLNGPASLGGKDAGLDVEAKADEVGCKVLEMHGIAPEAMVRVLQLAASNTSSHTCCDDLCRRICRLQAANSAQDR